MKIDQLKPEHLGMGIVLFKNALTVNESIIIPFLESLKDKALKEDYTFVYDDKQKPIYAINRSGHRYSLEDVDKSCNHIMAFIDDNTDEFVAKFFRECEDTM